MNPEDFDPEEEYTEENPLMIQPHHMKLLQRMNVRWHTPEFGAPEIDPKRPYGNSDVVRDIREITEMEDARREWCVKTHREMEPILQLFLERKGNISVGDEIYYTGDYNYEWRVKE